MIQDVDQSEVLAGAVIDSPVMGKIPPTSLSHLKILRKKFKKQIIIM